METDGPLDMANLVYEVECYNHFFGLARRYKNRSSFRGIATAVDFVEHEPIRPGVGDQKSGSLHLGSWHFSQIDGCTGDVQMRTEQPAM